MNIYISSDMEGIAQTKEWLDVRKTGPNYKKFQKYKQTNLRLSQRAYLCRTKL